jgi:hypothetical protein
MSNLKSKTNELEKVREELREAIGKRGTMLGTSHQDPTWSTAKAYNLGMDVDRLQEKEQEILQEIAEFKHDPVFIKDLEAKVLNIVTRRTKLQADLAKLKAEVFEKRGDRAQAVIDGADPMKVASDLYAQQDRMEVITLAIENCNLAASILDELGRDIPYQPAHAQDWPKGQKFDIPQVQLPQQR